MTTTRCGLSFVPGNATGSEEGFDEPEGLAGVSEPGSLGITSRRRATEIAAERPKI
jgi:hypothetical protein